MAVAVVEVLVLVGAALLHKRQAAVPPTGSRPNILLVTIDTMRWDHVGCYGASDASTPVLDRVAAEGARFETAIAHAPLTAPSHASVLTGVTPLRHGVRDNGAFLLPPALPSIPVVLKSAGYLTSAFVSGFPLDRRFGFSNGFDVYDDRLPRGGHTPAAQTERRADATTERVLQWLDTREPGHPWFAWVHYFDPHAPYDPPPEYRSRFASRLYDGEIAFVDDQIGRVLQRLRERGLVDRTIVLVTADHGESLGDHKERTHGVFVYDSTVRVPFIVRVPGVSPRVVRDVVARGVDVMPTLLDFAGVTAPPAASGSSRPIPLDGRSLRPALEGKPLPDASVYVESLMARRHLGWAAVRGLRDARWKFIDAPRPELYDLSSDPSESANVLAGHEQVGRAMAAALTDADRHTAESMPASSDRESAERLRALGYLGASGTARPTGRDPKDGIALINRLEDAIVTVRSDPRRAAAELREILREDPESDLAARQLAVALAAIGEHKAVIAQIQALRSRGAAAPEDLVLLSESLRVAGDAAGARDALTEAGRLDPRSPDPPLTAARASMAAGNLDDARVAYQAALDVSPDHPEALVGLGNIALARGDLPVAAGYFERVLSRDPADSAARTGLGMVRGREGRFADAVALLRDAVRDDPSNGEALAGLAAALARSGSPASAVPYFERALDSGLRTPAVLNGLGFARLESGDRAGALQALRASLTLRADQPGVQQAVRDLSADSPPRRSSR
jgi:choline-sulfatase